MNRAIFFPAGLAAALLLSACGGQPQPTPTPTRTPAPTATAAPSTPTPGAFVATVAAGVVGALADDAVAYVLEHGAPNVTADQLTAALLGVLGRLRDWTAGSGSETALADCRALLPGVIARADNSGPLEALLGACESGDRAQVGAALEVFAGIVP